MEIDNFFIILKITESCKKTKKTGLNNVNFAHFFVYTDVNFTNNHLFSIDYLTHFKTQIGL